MAAVTNILWLSGGIPTGIGSADTVTAPGTWSFTGTGLASFAGNVSIAGNLDVGGDITSRGTINLTVEDPFIDLGLGNSTTTSQAGGFTVQMAAAAGVTAATVHRFVTATQLEINDTGATALVANQIFAITGLTGNFAANIGLYAVASVSGTNPQVVNIKATATPSAPFLQTAFTDTTTTVLDSGAAFQTELSALAFANGSAFPDAGGTAYGAGILIQNYSAAAVLADFTANAAWTAVGAGSTTLQNAYDNGATIVTGANPILFTLTGSGFDVESGAVNFGSGALSALSTFDVEAGAVAVTSTGALNLTATGGLNLNATAAVNLDSIGPVVFDVDNYFTLNTIGSVNINAAPPIVVPLSQSINIGTFAQNALAGAAITIGNDQAGPYVTNASVTLRGKEAVVRVAYVQNQIDVLTKGNGGAINIGTENLSHTISVGTGLANQTINIGTGGSNLNPYTHTIAVGNSFGGSTLALNGTAVNIAADATAHTVSIATGSTGDQQVSIGFASSATDNFVKLLGRNSAVGVGTNAVGAPADKTITLETFDNGGVINIGAQPYSHTISIGTDATAAQTISIGSGNNTSYTYIRGGGGPGGTPGVGLQLYALGGINSLAQYGPLNLNTAQGQIYVNGYGGVNVNSSGGTINIGNNATNQPINIGTGGSRAIEIGSLTASTSVKIKDSDFVQVLSNATPTFNPSGYTGCVQILAGTAGGIGFANNDLAIEAGNNITIGATQTHRLTSNSSFVSLEAFSSSHGVQVLAAGGVGMQVESTAGVAARRIVTIDYGSAPTASDVPKVVLADANDATARFLAVTSDAIGAGSTGFAATVYGSLALVTFTSTPVAGDIGKPVYLSESAGQAALTAPTTSGANVIRLGYLVSASGSSVAQIQFQPQFIAAIP